MRFKNNAQRKAVMAKMKSYRVYPITNKGVSAVTIRARNPLEAKKKLIAFSKTYYPNTNAKPKHLIAKKL